MQSVDCVTRIRYLPILLLIRRDATHWCAVGGDVERCLAAKKRPESPDHLDANYRRTRGPDGLVPKPSTRADCQHRSTPALGQTTRGCPLASTAVGGDCHSIDHSVARKRPLLPTCLLSLRVWVRPRRCPAIVESYPR